MPEDTFFPMLENIGPYPVPPVCWCVGVKEVRQTYLCVGCASVC